MELKQVNQLMLAMGRTGIRKLVYKKGDFELELERAEKASSGNLEGLGDLEENPMKGDFEKHKAASTVETTKPVSPKPEDEAATYITSPMVGTFFCAQSPKDAPYVKVGDRVEKNSIVGVIEAMKVMSEVKAHATGIIAEILIENDSPVEFGTKLFRITTG